MLSIGPIRTNFGDILIKLQNFSFAKSIWQYRLRSGGHFVHRGDELSPHQTWFTYLFWSAFGLPRFKYAITWTNVVKFILWYKHASDNCIPSHGFTFMQDSYSFRHHVSIYSMNTFMPIHIVCPTYSHSNANLYSVPGDSTRMYELSWVPCTNTGSIYYVTLLFCLYWFNIFVGNLRSASSWPANVSKIHNDFEIHYKNA